MAEADLVGRYIFDEPIVAVADRVAARTAIVQADHAVPSMNGAIWYRTRDRATRKKPGWPEAPAILQAIYTMEDALVFGAALLTLINKCDRGQGRMRGSTRQHHWADHDRDGRTNAAATTDLYPFKRASEWAQGTVLDMRLTCENFTASNGDQFPISWRCRTRGGRKELIDFSA